jgi:hypothetical protein
VLFTHSNGTIMTLYIINVFSYITIKAMHNSSA